MGDHFSISRRGIDRRKRIDNALYADCPCLIFVEPLRVVSWSAILARPPFSILPRHPVAESTIGGQEWISAFRRLRCFLVTPLRRARQPGRSETDPGDYVWR